MSAPSPMPFLLFASLLAGVVLAGNPSFYPCPGDKAAMGRDVSCKVVALPPGMCSSCPLKAPVQSGTDQGKFKDCANIYETSTSTCISAMNEYVTANPCDVRRKEAMDGINSGNPSYNNIVTMDYFLYSVCEQCCDCVPMGASKTANSGQWVTDRGNCPAHAWYDICAILPQVTWFVKIGETTNGLDNKPKMCTELSGWFNSPFSNGWQKNPKTTITSSLDQSLASVLDATSCSASSIWNKCYDLEKLQGNLGTEGDFTGSGTVGSTNTANDLGISSNNSTDNSANSSANNSTNNSTNNSDNISDNNGTNNSTNNSTNVSVNNSTDLTNSTLNPGGATISCDGAFKWGCTAWNGTAQTCEKFGCKCFPGPFAPTPDSCFTSGGLQRVNKLAGEPNSTSTAATCFPGDATVVLSSGSTVRMDRLQIGDMVMVSPGKYSPVYLFSHRHSNVETVHIELSFPSTTLVLSPGHHLAVNGDLRPANSIRPGDSVETINGVQDAQSVRTVSKVGLYNPHTLAGSIVVNGVVCSTYTTAVNDGAAHALLSPLRALFKSRSLTERTAGTFMQYGAPITL